MTPPSFDCHGYPKTCERCQGRIMVKDEATFLFNFVGDNLGPHAWHTACKAP